MIKFDRFCKLQLALCRILTILTTQLKLAIDRFCCLISYGRALVSVLLMCVNIHEPIIMNNRLLNA